LLSVSTYHLKKNAPVDVNVTVLLNSSDSEISSFTAETLSWGIRKCQDLVDCPPNILHTDEYARQAQEIVQELQSTGFADTVTYQQFRGEELAAMGLYGIHGVGKGNLSKQCHGAVSAVLCCCDVIGQLQSDFLSM
jgi:leucyl aminopeptidase